MATISEPKATLPNDVVIVLLNAGHTGLSTSSTAKYQVAATPLINICFSIYYNILYI